jgi:hypothetical protein
MRSIMAHATTAHMHAQTLTARQDLQYQYAAGIYEAEQHSDVFCSVSRNNSLLMFRHVYSNREKQGISNV